MSGKDRFKYFRIEARELSDALNQGVLEFEKTGASRELVARLLRQAHTLKGASQVVRLPEVADLAHALEEVLAPFRDGGPAEIPHGTVDGLLKLLDALTGMLEALNEPAAGPPGESPGAPGMPSGAGNGKAHSQGDAPGPAPRSAPAPRLDTVRLEIREVDELLERLSEGAAGLALLRQETSDLDRLRRLAKRLAEQREGDAPAKLRSIAEEIQIGLDRFHRLAGATLDQTERELLQAHERAGKLRLMPAASLFDFLERAARDAARALGKQVRFEASGGDQRLDAPVLAVLQEALLHIVRNAVAHGLEDAGARRAAGKPAEGRIHVEVARSGGRISFRCRDDGRGIDVAAVRRSAAERGRLPPSAPNPLGLQDAVRILLGGGVSTSPEVTEVSGRGIGLDAVREAAERLQGEVLITSEPGRGTVVGIHVPYSMSILPALTVESAGLSMLIPFESIRRAMQVADAVVARSPEGDTVLFENQALPFLALEGIFPHSQERTRRTRPAVVVQCPAGMAVVGVDRILGIRETTVRPLPALATAGEIVAGASLDAEGNPCLVLDTEGLVRAARGRPGGKDRAAAPKAKPTILVVDDSLTTRMLEKSILESAGYEVDTADSAEDALVKSGQRNYGLFLVDVEMPGMNGFQFLEAIRGEAALRDIPSILVTSCSSSEDRKQGEAAGARDYIVKGEFDQARLLSRIRELAG